MSRESWNSKHTKYATTDWIRKPSLFSQYVVTFFPSQGKLLDVGCGQGQDSRFFAQQGYEVTGIDFSDTGIEIAKQKGEFPNLIFEKADISDTLPFDDSTFDVVYSHLALHYFDGKGTKALFAELARVLKSGGVLALLVNSVHDPEYKTGEKIEDDYYLVHGMKKHYFSADSLKKYVKDFDTIILDEAGETYKDRAISVDRLVRYVGTKK